MFRTGLPIHFSEEPNRLLAISCGLLILIKSDSNENYAYHLEPFMPVNLQPIMGLQ